MRAGVMRALAGVITAGGRGRVTVYKRIVYSGIYAQEWGGAFFAGYYMADFKG